MRKQPYVALITGGAQGIGRGIAEHLINHGWRVVVTDVDQQAGDSFVEAMGRNGALRFLCADVSREDQVRQVVEEAVNWGSSLDALINNAGIADPYNGPIEQLALQDWQRKLDVNLTGPFLMAKHATRHLRESNGCIINIASTRALQSEPQSEAYAASKGGLVALTHALAVSLGPEIRVNCISPGWIDVRAWQADAPQAVEPLSERDHKQHPAGRVGRPEDIANLVQFLISEDSSFITGQNFIIDGGMVRKMIYAE